MSSSPNLPLYFRATLIGGVIFIVLTLFALGRSVYRDSFQVGRYIADSTATIVRERHASAFEAAELEYARTPQYQQKVAKEYFGLRAPGEEVIILTNETQSLSSLLPDRSRPRAQQLLTTPQKWARFLFGLN